MGAAVLILVVFALARSGSHGSGGGADSGPAAAHIKLVARMAPYRLPAPISAESVVGLPGGPLILGGLDSGESSVGGVFQLDPASGKLREAGSLSGPLHDAAAAVLGNRVLVFGGGTEASSDEVQALPLSGGTVGANASAEGTGRLPTVRSDLSAVTLGGRAYVLGGYDGSAPLDSVLATADGSSFEEVATLPQPARYIAVAALGGRIYAFGGELANGEASDAIRVIDPGGRNGARGRPPAAGGLARERDRPRRARLRARRRSRRDGQRPHLALRPGVRQGHRGGTAAGGGRRRRRGRRRLDRLPDRRQGRRRRGARQRRADRTATRKGARRRGRRKDRERRVPPNPPPFRGSLMIADRGNDRLLVVNAQKKVLWHYPSHAHPGPAQGFYFPDDAFFTNHGTQIIANEEQNERIVRLAYPSGKLLWSYGHAGVAGSEPGYLHEPDDAYLWRDGTVSVADAQNCRVLLISHAKKVLREFGSPSACAHEPPKLLGSPNGDTPLPDGNLLVSEVNGSYIDEITRGGKLVWSVQLPIEYPSDPQQLGPDRYLVADYTTPGGIYKFNRAGKILWSYHPSSGPGMLDHPSLAERLPGGLIAVNDDYRHRLAIIDPKTRKVVWQYGHTDEPGRAHDYLNTPDGFDLLAPNGVTPTHPYTG